MFHLNVETEVATARNEPAACHRLFDFTGRTEMIFNHITLRVQRGADAPAQYLIDPFNALVTGVSLIEAFQRMRTLPRAGEIQLACDAR